MKGLFALLLAIACLAGCGKNTTTVYGPDGSTVVTEGPDGTRMKFEGADGAEATIETGPDGAVRYSGTDSSGTKWSVDTTDVDLKDFGIDIYPGATLSKEAGSITKVQEADAVQYSAQLTTTDSPAKVSAFYKERLKDIQSLSSEENEVVSGTTASGRNVVATAFRKTGDKETTIVLIVADPK